MHDTNRNTRGFLVKSLLCVAALWGLTGTSPGQQASQPDSVHLYFFTNHGCAPCRQVEPGIEALRREGYPVTTIILNDQPQWAEQFGVNRTPTVIMVADNSIVGRHAGLIDGVTLKQWFAAVGVSSGAQFAGAPATGGTKVSLPSTSTERTSPPSFSDTRQSATATVPSQLPSYDRSRNSQTFAGSSTLHKGTRHPENAAEKKALAATVRLKVEDPEGISYATGTVIHCHNGEWLVMTCGHVFRDSKGTGQITAEFNFGNGDVKSAAGQLISYDSDARDIGLVAIQAGISVESVSLASRTTTVDRGQSVFSIGCDQGQNPTIRRSEIKNRAAYDGAVKYDIYGRPVNGRSGGGLFTESGELIGVCNAAAVEEDEGIYTALETIHWQIAQVNLEHLFDKPTGTARPDRRDLFETPQPERPPIATASLAPLARPNQPVQTPVAWDDAPRGNLAAFGSEEDQEVIIIVRSKLDPKRAEAITISHPSKQLLNFLQTMPDTGSQPRQLDVARLREP